MSKRQFSPLRCPSCGNDGSPGKVWERNWRRPFKAIEMVPRYWEFDMETPNDSAPVLAINCDSDTVDWESGDGIQIECNACFDVFPVPKSFEVTMH